MEGIKKIRKKIDEIDNSILKLLSGRKEQIKKLKNIKSKLKKPIKDLGREKLILEKAKEKYEKEIFLKIIEESRKLQE